MASLQEVQQQLMASHEQVRLLAAEVTRTNQKLIETVAEFDRKANYLNGQVTQWQAQNAQLLAGQGGGGGGRSSDKSMQLVDLKTMRPKVFSGKAEESFRGWAKKVRSYCNSTKSGFKKFLKWIEVQQDPIPDDYSRIPIAWEHKVECAEKLYDFLFQHTELGAQVEVENAEDNGPEAWRKLVQRYDPLGESYIVDEMGSLMNVPRCKKIVELPAAISRWERAHALYHERSGGKSVPDDFRIPLLFGMVPQDKLDEVRMRHRACSVADKAYGPFSKILIGMANERIYDDRQKDRNAMDLDLVDREGQEQKGDYEEPRWTQQEWIEHMAGEEEDLDYLGGGKGGKARGKGKGGKGCHWCGGNHLKRDCNKFAADKKRWDEERAAKGLPPFVPRKKGEGRGGAGDNGKNGGKNVPLKSLEAENIEELEKDYVGIGMLEGDDDEGEADCGTLDADLELYADAVECYVLGVDSDGDDDDADDADFQTFTAVSRKKSFVPEKLEPPAPWNQGSRFFKQEHDEKVVEKLELNRTYLTPTESSPSASPAPTTPPIWPRCDTMASPFLEGATAPCAPQSSWDHRPASYAASESQESVMDKIAREI